MSELGKAICSSIQNNKDKIEKLTKQNERLKRKNKQLKEEKKQAIEYIKVEYLSKFDDFESPLRMTNKEDWKKLLEILGDKENGNR